MKFVLNRHLVETHLSHGAATVDFLRDEAGLTGVKVGCREGDCGACTVLLGTFHNGYITYRAVNSCILPLGKAAGGHLVTIEGLNRDVLTPIQQALVDEGATQCGFCTPGIVVSATAALLGGARNHALLEAALYGNICRCTGYASIKRAMQKVALPASPRIDDMIQMGIIPEYFKTIPEMLDSIVEHNASITSEARWVGGGTDLMVHRPSEAAHTPIRFVDNEIPPGIEETSSTIEISGTTTFEMLAASPLFQKIYPNVGKFMTTVASPQIRNVATVAGNLVNASPIGDMAILLLALDASVTLASNAGSRSVRLRDFFKGYKTIDLNPGERVVNVVIDASLPTRVNVERVARRTHMDIATVNTACAIRHQDGIIQQIRISAGGVAPIPFYLAHTSNALCGRPVTWDTACEAGAMARKEATPISDVRGSADYKSRLLERLVTAHFHALFGLEGGLP